MQAKHKTQQKRRTREADSSIVLWLVFCFPIGLMMMWSDRCGWKRAVKSAVSMGFVAVLLLLVLPQTRAPQQKTGGIEIVSAQAVVDLMGPTMEAGVLSYDSYVPKYIPKNNVLVQPTPSPEPYWVYCNDGGEKYHLKGCRFVKPSTPKATLIQAVDAGFKRCKECGSPKLSDIYGEDFVG